MSAELSIYYDVSGEGTPIVFQAHSHSQFAFFQVPYFSRYYRAITFDRRGTGRSTSGPKTDWTIKTFSEDLNLLLESMGIQKSIVAGESLGA